MNDKNHPCGWFYLIYLPNSSGDNLANSARDSYTKYIDKINKCVILCLKGKCNEFT